jgi:hypothetical protein
MHGAEILFQVIISDSSGTIFFELKVKYFMRRSHPIVQKGLG